MLATAASTADEGPQIDSLDDVVRELNQGLGLEAVAERPDAASVARGGRLYERHCAACHGTGAVGAPEWHRPDAQGRFPPPPLNGSAHAWHHPKAHLITIVRDGAQGMPAFGTTLAEGQIIDIIHWFQSLWPDELYAVWTRHDRDFRQRSE